jgi:hypothetical protein
MDKTNRVRQLDKKVRYRTGTEGLIDRGWNLKELLRKKSRVRLRLS